LSFRDLDAVSVSRPDRRGRFGALGAAGTLLSPVVASGRRGLSHQPGQLGARALGRRQPHPRDLRDAQRAERPAPFVSREARARHTVARVHHGPSPEARPSGKFKLVFAFQLRDRYKRRSPPAMRRLFSTPWRPLAPLASAPPPRGAIADDAPAAEPKTRQ